MSLKMFEFWVKNPVTGEWIHFLGQGERLLAAAKDGIENLEAPFRPKQNGRPQALTSCAVKLRDGRIVGRLLKAFESDRPYDPATEAQAMPAAAADDDGDSAEIAT
jgi:hypothetical protein